MCVRWIEQGLAMRHKHRVLGIPWVGREKQIDWSKEGKHRGIGAQAEGLIYPAGNYLKKCWGT